MVGPTNEIKNLIAGQFLIGHGQEDTSINPAHPSERVANYNQASGSDIESALEAAQAAQNEWASITLIQRALVLRRAADLLIGRRQELSKLMTIEQGKILSESTIEVDASIETIRYHADSARFMYGKTFTSSTREERIETLKQPLGVVAVVTPWNFPMQIPCWKIAPALLWGNAVIWKPASNVPALSFALAKIFHEAGVPSGVFNMVLASGHITDRYLIGSSKISGVSFTGSGRVGNSIAQSCLPRGIKIQLELGGNNAAIIMPDVDPEHAASQMLIGAMSGTGQKCTATRRIITVGSGHETFINSLIAKVNKLVVGDGLNSNSQIGPVISSVARNEIQNAVKEAVSDGGKIIAQAKLPEGDGFFVAPTLIEGDMTIKTCREEVFGPVVTIMNAATLEEAIDIANATEFGLTASIFSSSHSDIALASSTLQAGILKINAPNTGSEIHAPFGGLKSSTFPGPREQNADSISDFFTISKTVYHRLPMGRESS
ncbi:PutA NAD-dependent aldehyde dehydrogenases [Candidatus Nanopelagicaceae bacterium]